MFGVVYILIYISDQQYRNALLNYCHLNRLHVLLNNPRRYLILKCKILYYFVHINVCPPISSYVIYRTIETSKILVVFFRLTPYFPYIYVRLRVFHIFRLRVCHKFDSGTLAPARTSTPCFPYNPDKWYLTFHALNWLPYELPKFIDVIRFQSSLDPVFCSELCRVKSRFVSVRPSVKKYVVFPGQFRNLQVILEYGG